MKESDNSMPVYDNMSSSSLTTGVWEESVQCVNSSGVPGHHALS